MHNQVLIYCWLFEAQIKAVTTVPLTLRGMNWQPSPVTVCRMDAASERTWMYLQRVSGDGCQFMPLKVNGTTVIAFMCASISQQYIQRVSGDGCQFMFG